MTKNNTKVYDMFLDGVYQAAGSTKMLADHTGIPRRTLERYLYEGNDKGYTFEYIGKYAQIYALYQKEEFMMFGTLDQLAERTGMTKVSLEWFRMPSSEKRGGNYQVIKIEGEHEVVKEKQKVKHKVNIYELTINYKRYSGTAKELSKKTKWSQAKIRKNAKIVGVRMAEIKGINKNTNEIIYGTLEEVTDWSGVSIVTVRKSVSGNMYSPNFDFSYTGQYIVEVFVEDKPKAVKPVSEHISVKPVYTHKPVPMSGYAQQLFEHSTRHLRRDA